MQYARHGDVFAIKETLFSQLQLIFLLALMFFYPIWILVFQNDKINGGLFGRAILGITSLIILPFLVKYTTRLLKQRRIEVRRKESLLVLCGGAEGENKKIKFDEIKSFKIAEYKYLAMTVYKKNHTIVLFDVLGNELHLCSSDSRKNVEAVINQLSLDLPRPEN